MPGALSTRPTLQGVFLKNSSPRRFLEDNFPGTLEKVGESTGGEPPRLIRADEYNGFLQIGHYSFTRVNWIRPLLRFCRGGFAIRPLFRGGKEPNGFILQRRGIDGGRKQRVEKVEQ